MSMRSRGGIAIAATFIARLVLRWVICVVHDIVLGLEMSFDLAMLLLQQLSKKIVRHLMCRCNALWATTTNYNNNNFNPAHM